jgi:hypothetical protein
MKKLIIVCEEKLRRYGDFLAQLISRVDDQDGTVVGIKDGAAAAQVWTEKEYASNAAQISSEQYMLFIGNSKLFKEKRHHMQKKYSEYGMNYGWLGKQATLFVDRVVSLTEYESFFQLASNEATEGKQPEITRLLPAKHDEPIEETPADESAIESEPDDSEEIIEVTEPEPQERRGLKKLLVPLSTAKVAIKKTADQGKDTFNKVSDNINVVAKSREIEDQQYTCLVLLFYLNDLGNFLGISEG